MTDAKTPCSGVNCSSLRKRTPQCLSCDRAYTRSRTRSSLSSLPHRLSHSRWKPVSLPSTLLSTSPDREQSTSSSFRAWRIARASISSWPLHLAYAPPFQTSTLSSVSERAARFPACLKRQTRRRRPEIERLAPSARTASPPRPHRAARARPTP